MSDEKGEPTPTPVEPAPDSRLTERLLSRATDSLGLIDVRRAEQHYARIMDWLAARTPLLERLRTRYGLTEGEGMTGLAFAEPRGQEGAYASDEGTGLPAAPSSFTVPATEQIFTHVAQIPDDSDDEQTEVKRIARRGVPTFSPASSEPGPGADASTSHERGEVVRQEQGVVFKPALEQAVPQREQTLELQSPPPIKEVPAATVENSVARSADPAQILRPRPASNPAQESNSSHTRRTIPSIEERVAGSTSEQEQTLARGTNATNDADAVNTSTNANEPNVATKPRAPRVAESSSPDVLPSVLLSRAVEGEKGPSSAATGVKLPVSGKTRSAPVLSETPPPLAHAREVHAGDSGRASASLHAQQPLPLASSPAAAVERAETARQQTDDAPAVTHASSGGVETFTPGRARAQARTDEINVQSLTEKVSRHLARRLLVERERRGLGRR